MTWWISMCVLIGLPLAALSYLVWDAGLKASAIVAAAITGFLVLAGIWILALMRVLRGPEWWV